MQNGHETITPRAGGIVRQEFGATQLAQQAELAAIAVAAQAKAAVEARYVIALRQPRDLDEVRQKLLRECDRPGFAEVARYRKPVGDGVEGPSIRFAEAAIRCMTNILVEQMVTYDDDAKRVLKVTVTDLESNAAYSGDVTIPKRVERSRVEEGRTVFGQRKNSRGRPVYLVSATDDEILDREGALISKRVRSLALRLIPGDLVDECMERVIQTQVRRDAADPDAARKKLTDAFSTIGVGPKDLKAYLGVDDLAKVSPAELAELRAIFAAIKAGETTWRDTMEAKHPTRDESDASPADKKADELKAKIAAKVKAPATEPESPASGEVRAPAERPAERRATAKPSPATEAADHEAGLIRDAIDDADDEESLRAAQSRLEHATPRLPLAVRNELSDAFKKAAKQIGVSL